MSLLEQAATDYVAARIANDGSEPVDWMTRLAEVDRSWHALRLASGLIPPGDEFDL